MGGPVGARHGDRPGDLQVGVKAGFPAEETFLALAYRLVT